MRFIHETKTNAALGSILGSNLTPKTGELICRRTVLADDITIESRIVVDIDNAERGTGIKAPLNQRVIICKITRIELVCT